MWDILLPIFILCGIGLLAAILLVAASALFSVKTDETVAELTEACRASTAGPAGTADAADMRRHLQRAERTAR